MVDVINITEHFHYIGIFILLVIGGMGFPIPEGVTLIASGFLISHGIIRPIPALVVVFTGMLTGDMIIFYIGRKYGRMVVTHRKFHRIISPERLAVLEDKFNKWRTPFILFGRHLGFHVFLVAGIMRMPFLKFLALDIVSSVLTIAVMVGLGYIGGNSLQLIKRDIIRIEHIGILLVISLLAIYLIFRHIRTRK